MSLSSRVRKEAGRVLLAGLMSSLLIVIAAGTTPILHAKEPAIEELKADLKSSRSATRKKAARALGRTLDRDATPALLAAAGDGNPDVRREVIKSLGLLRDLSAITMLLTALNDSAHSVRQEAIIALVNLYTEQDASFFLTREAKRLYTRLNPFSGPLRSDATMIEPDVKVGSAVVDGIAERLDDSDKLVRFYAANALGVLRAQRAIPQMLAAMKVAGPNLRVAILRSFYKIRDRSVDEQILTYLYNANKKVRDETILTLGLFKSRKALPQLQAFYDQNPNTKLRLKSLEAISLIGDTRSLGLFRRVLGDPDRKYRQFAAEGIARVGDDSVVEEVSRSFLDEKKPSTRLAMSFALFRLGRPEYLDRLVASLKERFLYNQAEAYLIELGKSVSPQLVKYLGNDSPEIRQKLCRVLGLIGDDSTMESLRPLLRDSDAGVVSEASRAIRRIGAR